MNPGILLGLGAYLIWGTFPLYDRLLHDIPALELVAHRVTWSVVVLMVGVVALGRWGRFRKRVSAPGIWRFHVVSGAMVGLNWLLYVWGVNAGRVVECSLGYFLNPLVSIALGVVVLRERLRPGQWAGVVLAAGGVLYLAVHAGGFPWLAVSLAVTFGLYGLLKKKAPLGSVDGLLAETLAMLGPSLLWIAWSEGATAGPLHEASLLEWGLVVGTGLVTTVPLLMFSAAARRIPLFFLGILQYVSPTMQFLVGVLWFGEPLGMERLHGFLFVWVGLGAVVVDGICHIAARRRDWVRDRE